MHALFDALSSGSVSTQPDGSLVIQSSYVRIGAWLLAFLVLAAVSFVLVHKRILIRLGIVGAIVSLAILIVVLPAVITEKVEVSPDRLMDTEGPWFSRTQRDVDLDGLAAIHEHSVK